MSKTTALEHRQKGLELMEKHNYVMAGWEFSSAIAGGDVSSYAELGGLIYAGLWTKDMKPDVNEALRYWSTGAKLGDLRCKELYDLHKEEYISESKTIRFKNGDVYKGSVSQDGKPHGRGRMEYKLNGYYAYYEGMWEDGQRSGKGHYRKSSTGGGAYHSYDYEGEWLHDQMDGQGVETQSDECGIHLSTVTEVYTGGFRAGKRHGHGVIVKDNFTGRFSDGKNRFEGEFQEGKTVGRGVWKYANGDMFEGEFADYGNKHGHGVYTYKSGLKFEGEWEQNNFISESLQADPSLKTPMLLVGEEHSGFDYNHSGRFIFPAQKGFMPYSEAARLYNSLGDNAGLLILAVTEDSVTFKVGSQFTHDGKPIEATIHRGENLKFEDIHTASARIYDEEFDYTIEDHLEVICR